MVILTLCQVLLPWNIFQRRLEEGAGTEDDDKKAGGKGLVGEG